MPAQEWVQYTSKFEIRRLLYFDCGNCLKDNELIKLVGGMPLMIKFQSLITRLRYKARNFIVRGDAIVMWMELFSSYLIIC